MGLNQAIDITTSQRKTILALLEKYLPNTTAWVYGSRVKWTSRPQSDLDMVVFSAPEQHRKLSDLREGFEESNLPFGVDLFVWDEVPEQFRKQIKAEHVVLVESLEAKSTQDNDWETTRWGELATLEYGKAFRYYKSSTGPYRVFGTNGPIGWHDEMLHPHPGVIIGRKGAYRGVHYSARPFFVIDTAFFLKPKVKMDTRWAYYQLLGQNINDLDSGSAIPSTRREDFYNLPVKVPPLAEQRAIAHVLGTLDDKIELNRRMNETLEAMVRALFKSWFVDFDPVRAKMEGRDTGLPPDIDHLFPNRLVDSELGKIPEGWEAKALGDLVELAYGKSLRATDRKSGLIPVYGSNGQIGWHDKKLVAGPGIVVGRKGNPGIVKWVHSDFFPIDTTFYVVPRDTDGDLPFLFFALITQDLPSVAADSAVPGLNRKLAYMNRQLVPEKKLMDEFNGYVNAIFIRRHDLEQESHTLGTQRDVMMPKLVSGELRMVNFQ